MSRIILEKYKTGEPRYVVGWDLPVASYFWQEFNPEPVIEEVNEGGERLWKVTSYAHKVRVFKTRSEADERQWDNWEEIKRFRGYERNELPDLNSFVNSLPDDLKDLMTHDEVLEKLKEHSMTPDAGRIVIDMSDLVMLKQATKSYKVEVLTVGSDKWASNAVRFATLPEAEQAGQDLFNRWMACTEWRAVPSTDPVNYKWENGGAVAVS